MLLDPKALIATTFYADANGIVDTVCPSCGLKKKVNVAGYKTFSGLFSINCDCGQDYKCRFDFKRAPEPEPLVFPVDSQGLATVQCPNCNVQKVTKAPDAAQDKIFTVRCTCGHAYKGRFKPQLTAQATAQATNVDLPMPIFLVEHDSTADVVCPACGVHKQMRLPANVATNRDYTISCGCGEKFKCRFERAAPDPEPSEDIPFIDLDTLVQDNSPRVFYADSNDMATAICPSCGLSKTFKVPDSIRPDTILKVDCKCGKPFKCRFEFHNPKRKLARVPGSYYFLEPNEMKDRDPVVYFANPQGDAVIVCRECGFSRNVNANNDKNLAKKLGFHCTCGNIFPFRVDLRREFRKHVNLAGQCKNLKTGVKSMIYVRDLSMGGVGFNSQVTNEEAQSHPIASGDHLELTFRLDDRVGTEITREVVVRIVRGNFVGTKFAHRKIYDKELGFYLMP